MTLMATNVGHGQPCDVSRGPVQAYLCQAPALSVSAGQTAGGTLRAGAILFETLDA